MKKYFYIVVGDKEILHKSLIWEVEAWKVLNEPMLYDFKKMMFSHAQSVINLSSDLDRDHYNIIICEQRTDDDFSLMNNWIVDNRFHFKPYDGTPFYVLNS